MEFCQKVTYTAKSPYRKQRRIENVLVSRFYSEKCLRLTNRVLEGTFTIPDSPSTTDKSSIIYVQYTLKVTVLLPCCSSDPVVEIPIIIGTVSIGESNNQSVSPTVMPAIVHKYIDSNLPANNNQLSSPPTFEEAVGSSPPFSDVNNPRGNRIRFTEKYY